MERNQSILVIILTIYFISLTNGLDQLKYVWGDALDDPLANGPDGNPYPWDKAAKIASKQRTPRFFGDHQNEAMQLLSPSETRNILLKAFQAQEHGVFLPGTSFMPPSALASSLSSSSSGGGNVGRNHRQGRAESSNNHKNNNNNYNNDNYYSSSNKSSTVTLSSSSSSLKSSHKNINSHTNNVPNGASNKNKHGDFYSPAGGEPDGCVPSRLCASTYNTTAPLYGVSLTSGQPVTIVQKFPDLLQQVVFQVCKTTECEVIHGECVQTYLPYLFLVIPLGPVTLTTLYEFSFVIYRGQDYVLVESGCVCRPKYARRHDEPPPLPFIQSLQN